MSFSKPTEADNERVRFELDTARQTLRLIATLAGGKVSPSASHEFHLGVAEEVAHLRDMHDCHYAAWVRAADENAMLRERLGLDPMQDLDEETAALVGRHRAALAEIGGGHLGGNEQAALAREALSKALVRGVR